MVFIALLIALAAPAQGGAQPERVWIGVYVVNLLEFELKTSSFTGDFYLWVRSEGKVDGTGFEIMNGAGEPCEKLLERTGRVRYHQYRCRYRFHNHFDVAQYPLDQHELKMEFEDKALPITDLVYAPDHRFTALDSAVALPGWRVGRPRARVVTHHYSSFGDPGIGSDEAPYSRFILTIPLRRAGSAVYLKSFLVMFLSVGVALLGCVVAPEHVEARLGMGVGGIFGVVSSYLMVAESLPETAQFTLADKLHLVAMAFVFFAILGSVLAYRIALRHGQARAERLDRWMSAATALGFAAAVWAVTTFR